MISEDLILTEQFSKFFLANYPKVKAFALRLLMSEADAEDVAQDIFIKLINMPAIWQDDELVTRYLFRMTKNHIFNVIKHKNIEQKYKDKILEKHALFEEVGIEENYHAKETSLIIHYAIEQMPERRRDVFKMSRYEGKSNNEISEALNMSVRTVERHIYLALRDLKACLKMNDIAVV
jgi:RNA polymerase sigma-70 factor (ECF subfamily)